MAPKSDLMQNLVQLREKMNSLFEEGLRRGNNRELLASSSWTPLVDIYETQSEVLLFAELPGMAPEEIQIGAQNGVLFLEGERRLKPLHDANYQRVERSYGNFKRTFTLPDTVDVEHVSAEYHCGVLEIVMPKKDKMRSSAKHKRIPVIVKK